MYKFVYVLLVCAFVFTGCSTAPKQVEGKNSTSIIVGHSERRRIIEWETFRVASIDGEEISYFWSTSPANKKVPISPGLRKLIVFTEFNRSLGDRCPCQAFSELDLNVLPNSSYKLSGSIEGLSVTFVIKDQNGSIVAGPKRTIIGSSRTGL